VTTESAVCDGCARKKVAVFDSAIPPLKV